MKYSEKIQERNVEAPADYILILLDAILLAPYRLIHEVSCKVLYLAPAKVQLFLDISTVLSLILNVINLVLQLKRGVLSLWFTRLPLLVTLVGFAVLLGLNLLYRSIDRSHLMQTDNLNSAEECIARQKQVTTEASKALQSISSADEFRKIVQNLDASEKQNSVAVDTAPEAQVGVARGQPDNSSAASLQTTHAESTGINIDIMKDLVDSANVNSKTLVEDDDLDLQEIEMADDEYVAPDINLATPAAFDPLDLSRGLTSEEENILGDINEAVRLIPESDSALSEEFAAAFSSEALARYKDYTDLDLAN